MSHPDEPWLDLIPGDGLHVKSQRGRAYEATLLLVGPEQAGLYVRMRTDLCALGRLTPARLDAKTFQKLLPGELVVPGNEVILATRGGAERRGRVVEPLDERVVLTQAMGEVFSAPIDDIVEESFRLLFPAKDLRKGDEFLVTSRSGREYRGRATAVGVDRIGALTSQGDTITLRVDNLDLETLEVLIPLPVGVGSSKA